MSSSNQSLKRLKDICRILFFCRELQYDVAVLTVFLLTMCLKFRFIIIIIIIIN